MAMASLLVLLMVSAVQEVVAAAGATVVVSVRTKEWDCNCTAAAGS